MYPNYYQFNQPQIYGKVVQTQEQISPSEIPMDGNIAVFPRNDLGEIYIKRWMPNGSINTIRYLPDNGNQFTNSVIPTPNVTETVKSGNLDSTEEILHKLDELYKKLDEVASAKASAKPRKEVTSNE